MFYWEAGPKDAPAVLLWLEDVADHLVHPVEIVGIDYVRIGSDFDDIFGDGERLGGCFKDADAGRCFAERGYAESDLKKILGGNHLRVIREVGE